MNYILKACPV